MNASLRRVTTHPLFLLSAPLFLRRGWKDQVLEEDADRLRRATWNDPADFESFWKPLLSAVWTGSIDNIADQIAIARSSDLDPRSASTLLRRRIADVFARSCSVDPVTVSAENESLVSQSRWLRSFPVALTPIREAFVWLQSVSTSLGVWSLVWLGANVPSMPAHAPMAWLKRYEARRDLFQRTISTLIRQEQDRDTNNDYALGTLVPPDGTREAELAHITDITSMYDPVRSEEGDQPGFAPTLRYLIAGRELDQLRLLIGHAVDKMVPNADPLTGAVLIGDQQLDNIEEAEFLSISKPTQSGCVVSIFNSAGMADSWLAFSSSFLFPYASPAVEATYRGTVQMARTSILRQRRDASTTLMRLLLSHWLMSDVSFEQRSEETSSILSSGQWPEHVLRSFADWFVSTMKDAIESYPLELEFLRGRASAMAAGRLFTTRMTSPTDAYASVIRQAFSVFSDGYREGGIMAYGTVGRAMR